MNQGDIVITKYPFSSFKQFKVRPALIISNKEYNHGDNRILIGISTKNGSYAQNLNNEDLSEGNLLQESYIRYSHIMTMQTDLIFKKIATLKEKPLREVINKLVKTFQ
jgi:mRNA-degrading endonuclease toxin of MazEF toxin-antitoxin module